MRLDEGRIQLEKRNPAGAAKTLLEAERKGEACALSGLPLISTKGQRALLLPAGQPASDRLNLSLAQAYAGMGNRKQALERLKRVLNSRSSPLDELDADLEALRTALKVTVPQRREVRLDPEPAAELRLKDLEGKEVALSDFKDRVVMVMFWATW